MRKRYYRFFWGFLKKQENWLNDMADRGYRLARTGTMWYEFENCEPGRYRYAVEFVGGKSKKNADAYAVFLEDCGYRVFFKNLNLSYSKGKTVFRPWAEPGGRAAADKGSRNKELLLVEKENDGKDFELHTDEDDIREYHKAIRRPWIFLAAAVSAVALIFVGSAFLMKGSGTADRTVKIGYVGSDGWDRWTGRYLWLDGTMKKELSPESEVIRIQTETESGDFSVEVRDMDGNVIFAKSNMGDDSLEVAVPDKVSVTITADHHKGSFSIE